MKNIKGTISSISNISLAIFLVVAAFFVGLFLILGTIVGFATLGPVDLEPENFDFRDLLIYITHIYAGYCFIGGVLIPIFFICFAIHNSKCNMFEWHVRTKGGFDTDYQRDSSIKVMVIDFLLAILFLSVSIVMAVLIPIKDISFYIVFVPCLIMSIVALVGSLCKISLVKLPVIPGGYVKPKEDFPDHWNLS